ncbi:hypothetical protein GALMADRAFT_243656 [Galerina marginata CBS 339.88]|uniref:Ricin B lectin domain-containing protein n=1 Tax=Galerina marginata (strain CBS 339.88) TaxID=685588 RepID=A0A067TB41_GALM3|nr:hypothetical protein GALMADRAFT_243656 [Galerina marginata CBS 339.88]
MSPPDPSKTYYIRNNYLDQYLALNEFDLVVERNKVADGRHQWRFVPVHGHGATPAGYYIQNVATNKFLCLRKFTKSSDGMEDAWACTTPQFFKIQPQAGHFWIIFIDDATTQQQKYYLNCYINVFDFCNYHAYHTTNGCKEGSRRQWAFEPTT